MTVIVTYHLYCLAIELVLRHHLHLAGIIHQLLDHTIHKLIKRIDLLPYQSLLFEIFADDYPSVLLSDLLVIALFIGFILLPLVHIVIIMVE